MLSGLALSAALLVPSQGPAPAGPPAAITATAPELLPKTATQPPPAADAQQPPAAQPAQPAAPPAMSMPAGDTAGMAGMAGQPGAAAPSLSDNHLGPPYRMWAEADYLLYWLKPARVPVLVGGGPAGTNPPLALIGGRNVDYGPADGGSVTLGTWLNDRHTFGLGLSAFILEQRSAFAAVNSDPAGNPVLFRPFTDALTLQPAQLLVAAPGALAGGAFVSSGIRLDGAEIFAIHNVIYCPRYSLNLLAGARYLDLDEYLQVTSVTRPLGGGAVVFGGAPVFGAGSPALTVSDRFRTRNQFYGGTLGVRGEYYAGPAFFRLTMKAGLGNNHETVQTDGLTALTPGGAPFPTGLLAVSGANTGRRITNRLAVVSEVGAQVGLQVASWARVLVGYDFLYLNNVVRPGGQIDPLVNTRLLPTSTTFGGVSGVVSPLPTRARDDFFAHGLRFGVELQY